MINKKPRLFSVFLSLATLMPLSAQQVIKIKSQAGDMTTVVRNELSKIKGDDVHIVFEEGEYFFKPDFAFDKYCAITNHGNGVKKILFPISDVDNVTIEGNGAKFIFHGQYFPFLFENCDDVVVKDLTIDWDIPFTFLAEVTAVNPEEGWREVKPLTEGYSWKYTNGNIQFPNIDGFNYQYLGSTLPFEKETKRVVRGAIDTHSHPTKVEKKANGIYRIYEKSRYYPPVGSMLSSKGDRENDRYAPAFDFKECRNITLDDITIHHALGMAFLFERSQDITIKDCNVVVEKGSPRVISSTADATHFANCRGEILIEGCRFENMLDDGTNVHGTYVSVEKILDNKNIVVALEHFEQMGFKFADKGDEMWFIKAPSPARQEVNTVASAEPINEKYIKLTFEQNIPSDLRIGDIVENKTWNPEFTMRGCSIQNHRARAIILKTPLKTVIEDNYLSSMMSAILFRGETFFWFESGGVNDVTIRNNYIKNAGDCGTKHAVLYVTPRLGKEFVSKEAYDKNIIFENNTIDTYLPRFIIAEYVDNLQILNNTIIFNEEGDAPLGDAPMFDLTHSSNVVVKGNSYKGRAVKDVLKSDDFSRQTVEIKRNKGFKL